MTRVRPVPSIGAAIALLFAAVTALAQQPASPEAAPPQTPPPQVTQAPAANHEPAVGQRGKDVVWVPTPQPLVDKMLDMAKVTPKDYLIDLGSGDGRLVITAAKRNVRALGIEYNPELVEVSRRAAQAEGVAGRARFVKADLFKSNLSQATVITMFLLPDLNLKLRPRLLKMKPGTRLVSNSFDMGDWKADETATLGPDSGCVSWCTAMLWIVPAKVEGTHKLPNGELTIKQRYQMLTGSLRTEGDVVQVTGKITGDRLALNGGGKTWRGVVNGKSIELQ